MTVSPAESPSTISISTWPAMPVLMGANLALPSASIHTPSSTPAALSFSSLSRVTSACRGTEGTCAACPVSISAVTEKPGRTSGAARGA